MKIFPIYAGIKNVQKYFQILYSFEYRVKRMWKKKKMTLFHRVTTKHVKDTLKFSLSVENFV